MGTEDWLCGFLISLLVNIHHLLFHVAIGNSTYTKFTRCVSIAVSPGPVIQRLSCDWVNGRGQGMSAHCGEVEKLESGAADIGCWARDIHT